MKYTYYYEETSQDTRCWEIESEVKLTEDEIQDLALETTFEDGDTSSGDTYKVTFKCTEYGDDCQCEITGDEIKQED
tara:strand:- start:367 stop:597 length:231 start_codon:yes stop_codon:yes gene_type:complete